MQGAESFLYKEKRGGEKSEISSLKLGEGKCLRFFSKQKPRFTDGRRQGEMMRDSTKT
jgi:hypothetical protein